MYIPCRLVLIKKLLDYFYFLNYNSTIVFFFFACYDDGLAPSKPGVMSVTPGNLIQEDTHESR